MYYCQSNDHGPCTSQSYNFLIIDDISPLHLTFSVARVVRFQQIQYTIGEGDGNATVMIVMNGTSAVNVIVNLRTIPGSATGKYDIIILIYIDATAIL